MAIRTQLTLFLSDNSEEVESVRKRFNPVQYNLIAAHVTLCREHETGQLEGILENIKSIKRAGPIRIAFGTAERFADGTGVFLPAKAGLAEFSQLRKDVLRGFGSLPEKQFPHITLMHPRNSTCTDVIFNQINKYQFPTSFSFDRISLIEQQNGERWTIVRHFSITENAL